MPARVDFQDYEKLLWSMARRVHRRLYAAGARTTQLADIFQELAVAWCKARDCWEPQHNVPFGAYLARGMSNHINRWVTLELRQRHIAPFDLDETGMGEDGDGSLMDIVPADVAAPDEEVVKNDLLDFIKNPLRWRDSAKAVSARTIQFLEFLASPPKELIDMLNGAKVRSEYARSRGVQPSATPRQITAAMVFDLMGAERAERTAIYTEIRHLAAEISQQ